MTIDSRDTLSDLPNDSPKHNALRAIVQFLREGGFFVHWIETDFVMISIDHRLHGYLRLQFTGETELKLVRSFRKSAELPNSIPVRGMNVLGFFELSDPDCFDQILDAVREEL